MAYTTADFITSVKTRGMIPSSQITFTSTSILALGDEELRSSMVPMLLSVMNKYYEAVHTVSISANVAAYDIPDRAIGGKLSNVELVDASGNLQPIRMIDDYELSNYNALSGGTPAAFYLRDNQVVLVPTPTSVPNVSLRMTYYRRPNTLIETTSAGLIESINTGSNQVTVVTAPSGITSNTQVDLVKAKPGFQSLAVDQTITVASNVYTFASLPSNLQVGDYVALSGQAPVVQLPLELHPCLQLMVAITILKALGHKSEAGNLEEDLYGKGDQPGKLDRALQLVSGRVDAKPKKVFARNGVLNPGGNYSWLLKP